MWNRVACELWANSCEHLIHFYPGPRCWLCLGSGQTNVFVKMWRWVRGKIARS